MKAFLERWRDIEGYEGLYQVSDFGEVRSLNYHRTGQTRDLKPRKNRYGYLQVSLCKDSKVKTHYVHRLVASTFIENPNNLPEINHKDENKENNVVTNLEYCDHKYNMTHGTLQERSADARRKKPLQLTLDYVFVKEWASISECRRNGFDQSAVAACCRNEYCSQLNVYKGSRWMYAEDYYKLFT